MTPDLRLIRYFVIVAEEGNVTRAAERLHISQPSLSAAIRQLETQLGVELLVRVGRRIEITPAGELLRERGRELLDHADALVDEVRDRHQAGASRLSLGRVRPAAGRLRRTAQSDVARAGGVLARDDPEIGGDQVGMIEATPFADLGAQPSAESASIPRRHLSRATVWAHGMISASLASSAATPSRRAISTPWACR